MRDSALMSQILDKYGMEDAAGPKYVVEDGNVSRVATGTQPIKSLAAWNGVRITVKEKTISPLHASKHCDT
jgi:hypothetical protein